MSRFLALALALAVAGAALTACSSPSSHEAVCVDQSTGERLPDDYCDRGDSHWLWYYLGQQSAIPPVHSHVSGGTYRRPSGTIRTGYPVTGLSARKAATFHAPRTLRPPRGVRVTVPKTRQNPQRPAVKQQPAPVKVRVAPRPRTKP